MPFGARPFLIVYGDSKDYTGRSAESAEEIVLRFPFVVYPPQFTLSLN